MFHTLVSTLKINTTWEGLGLYSGINTTEKSLPNSSFTVQNNVWMMDHIQSRDWQPKHYIKNKPKNCCFVASLCAAECQIVNMHY